MRSAPVVAAAGVAVIVVVASLFVVQQGNTGSTISSSTSSVYTSSQSITTITSTVSGPTITTATANSSNGLQLRFALDFSRSADMNNSVMVSMVVEEYNALTAANNATKSSAWALSDLSDGTCGTFDLPYGVALYQGYYTAANITQAQPLPIYPMVACPMMVRYVTGYLFQPSSDMALILPGTGNATEMLSMVNATGEYSQLTTTSADQGMGGASATSNPTPFPLGTYTAVAGDEWGALVIQHFELEVGQFDATEVTTMSG